MRDSIIFLGTGGDSIIVGKQKHASGGIAITIDDNLFMLDPGPGTLIRMKQHQINPRETVAVLVTHHHLNHAGGVNELISAMTYNGMDKHGLIIAPESVLEGEDSPLTPFYRSCVERAISFKEGSRVAVNHVEIFATPARHHVETTGFKLKGSNFSVSYTSDTEYSATMAEAHSSSDILIINCKNPSGINEKGHMNADDATKLIEKAKPKLAVITHYGIKAAGKGIIDVARDIQKQTKVQVLAARDGLMIDPITFASKVRQQKLSKFSD